MTMDQPYGILTTRDFDRDLRKLDRTMAKRIARKIEWLARHPELLAEPLQGLPPELTGLHKYRVGDYRILLWPDHSSRTLTLHAVGHRREIYRRL